MSSTAVLSPPRSRAVSVHDPETWLGIDIGGGAIKLAQVARHREQWVLQLSHLIPAGSRTIDRPGLEGGLLLELFRERLSRMARPGTRDAACVLSAGLVSLNTLELPPGSPDETRMMIAAELAGLGEVEPEFGAFENAGGSGSSGMIQHTVVSLPTATAGVIADNLWQLGYACQAIDGLPCIHARAAVLAERGVSSETIGVLDWGATTPMLTIVSRGRPVFTRTLRDCGLNAAIKSAADRIRFEPDELHELLMACGQSSSFGPLASARSSEILRELTDRSLRRLEPELQRTLRFLKRQGKDLVPARLLVIGGGALLPNVAERLTETAETPTAVWQMNGGRREVADADRMQAVFASAIALSTLGVSA
ncbi:MAG TPA: hypothetical protein VM452_19815 [Caulifigura sp.]|nr:hypothetical protein [Caulifigura sp.]